MRKKIRFCGSFEYETPVANWGLQKETASFNWGKITYRTSVVCLSPYGKIYFFGWLFNWTICSCWNENEHLLNSFPPQKNIVEISFLWEGKVLPSLDSFSITWVKQNNEGSKGVKRLYGRYFFHSQINLVSKHWLWFHLFLFSFALAFTPFTHYYTQ